MRKIFKMLLDSGRDVHGGLQARLGEVREGSRRRKESQAEKERLADVSQMGMTLIEIMVVVAIIGLLMGAVGVVAFADYQEPRDGSSDLYDGQ